MENLKSQIVIYKDHDGHIKIDVRFDGNTVWLTQDIIATLYGKGRSTITEHIQNIFQEGELDPDSVCREFRRTGADGKEYAVKYCNLDLHCCHWVSGEVGARYRVSQMGDGAAFGIYRQGFLA
jgi:hypothetical protein